MSIKRCVKKIAVSIVLLLGITQASQALLVTNGQSVSAYGIQGAYLITELSELLQWNPVIEKWVLVAKLTPVLRQIDCLSAGVKVIGTDINNKVWLWNGVAGIASAWSKPKGETEFRWVQYDPITDETRALAKDLDAWTGWDKPVLGGGDPWYKYLPAGPQSETNQDKLRSLVDKREGSGPGYHRWGERDIPYFVKLNQSGQTIPFYIYYYGDNTNESLNRITDPPIATHNIDDIAIRVISYDEDHQNLWGIGSNGRPYQWDNETQQWILRDQREDAPNFVGPLEPSNIPEDTAKILKAQNDYYVRTTYIKGQHRPRLIILKDSMIMHLILGTITLDQDAREVDIIIVEGKNRRDSKFHNILLLPKETPQKMVHPDSNRIKNRIRENHYLERLLVNNGIVANDLDIGVYPAEYRLVRR